MDVAAITIQDQGQVLCIQLAGGECARFHAQWLRDSDPGPAGRDPGNGQRVISILDIPEHVRILSASLGANQQLRLRFDDTDNNLTYSINWLLEHRYDCVQRRDSGWLNPETVAWHAQDPPELVAVSYPDMLADDRLRMQWLARVARFGMARLCDVPCTTGAVCQVAETFGFVRETNYGRWFDVRATLDPSNLAYTNRGLEAHTDNPYRDPAPTLQLLACLENSADGGESIAVDGFSAVQILRQESRHHFDLLSRYNVDFEFSGDGNTCLRSNRPMIELGVDGELRQLRFNSRSIAPLVTIPYEEMNQYYSAYRHLARIINRSELQVEFRLAPGDLFIVDNTRVLHARKAFSGTGSRWLQGCYADRDGLLSTLRILQRKHQLA